MLNDDHRVAGINQPTENFEQLLDIGEVEAGGGLVEDVQRAAGGAAGELAGELDALPPTRHAIADNPPEP